MALFTCTVAEPPSYLQIPDISPGYVHTSPLPRDHHSTGTEYIEVGIDHPTSEGLHLDSNLLHKIESALIQHENSGRKVIALPSPAYGVPQSSYGPPSHWSPSSKVVGIDFGHLRQSIQVAQYLGKERYAPTYDAGWSSGNSGWNADNSGWSADNSGWNTKSSGWNTGNSGWNSGYTISKPTAWVQPSPKYGPPAKTTEWSVVKPSSNYGVPRW